MEWIAFDQIKETVYENGHIENPLDRHEVETQLDYEIGRLWGENEITDENYKYLLNKLNNYLTENFE
jgi:hypothetical protein